MFIHKEKTDKSFIVKKAINQHLKQTTYECNL